MIERVADYAQQYRQGGKLVDLARSAGVSFDDMRAALIAHGVKIRTNGQQPKVHSLQIVLDEPLNNKYLQMRLAK